MTKKPKKVRLDQRLVDLGLAPSIAMAQAMILAGEIGLKGRLEPKAGLLIPEDLEVRRLSKESIYVSRGGDKLAGALEDFAIDPKGWVCLDVGASTGGFTDCLLRHGAEKVFTIDVGTAQLDQKIRTDPRVVVREQFHAKDLSPSLFDLPIDLAVVDVSFISLRSVLPQVMACVRPEGCVLALIKPQFEAPKKDIENGVLHNEQKRQHIVRTLVTFAEKDLGLKKVAVIDSRLHGPKGNREVFLWGHK